MRPTAQAIGETPRVARKRVPSRARDDHPFDGARIGEGETVGELRAAREPKEMNGAVPAPDQPIDVIEHAEKALVGPAPANAGAKLLIHVMRGTREERCDEYRAILVRNCVEAYRMLNRVARDAMYAYEQGRIHPGAVGYIEKIRDAMRASAQPRSLRRNRRMPNHVPAKIMGAAAAVIHVGCRNGQMLSASPLEM